MKADRIVVDTNVLISGALSAGGPPGRLVRHVLLHGRLLFCDATFAELHTRLWRPKFDRYLCIEDRKQLLHDFGATGVWVDVPAAIACKTYCRDPDDDKFLQLAQAGQASLLVSGDHDLLDVGEVEGIHVVTPAQACVGFGI